MSLTHTARIKLTKAQVTDLGAAGANRKAAEHVTRAYGLTDNDTIDRVSLNRGTNVVSVTFTVTGPRQGTKWSVR